MDADYAVIGGGLIGLITAQSLAFHGKKVLLFKEDHSTIQDKRAYGLTYGSLRRLDYLGLSLPLTTKIESLSLYFNQYKSHEINATAMNIPYLGANILHSVINDSFLTQLSPAITIVHEKVFGLTLDQHWSICTSLNNTYHVDYIAGSDGSESLVRRITSPLLAYEYTFPQTALVFHLTHSEEKSAEKAYQISLDNFLIGLLPLNQKQSYFVMTGPHQDIAALKNKIELEDHLPHFFQKNKIIHDL
ncbi:FAD-dependent monooxygenase, partial [bacterium]|nr:FAD-dependent monooxygenase [bacterium]